MTAASPFRLAIIECIRKGMRSGDIVRKLGVNKMLVNRVIKRYKRLGTSDDMPRSGRPVTVTTPEVVKAVRERIRRNPERSMRKMAIDFEMNRGSMQIIVKKKLNMIPYRFQKGAFLTEKNKALRVQKAKKLLLDTRSGSHLTTLFTDEKLFTVEANKNGQNNRIIAKDYFSACQNGKFLNKTSHPASVMVFAGICANGKTPLIFVEPGAKVNQTYYREKILETEVLPWAQGHFGNASWTFQQDSAPAHRAKATQDWCKAHFPQFISSSEWPASSPDLNPLDYSVWGYLTQKVSTKNYPNITALKTALLEAWDEIDTKYLRAVVDAYPKRLRAVIRAKGGRFENNS
uniref:Paired domain-containing protein n=1 Tax=Caenorhabditis tropicalis TaxID=1561998 RepID=A0A1I7T5D4_9PELO